MRGGQKWLFAFVDMLIAYSFVLTATLFFLIPNINPPAKDNPDTLPPPGSIAVLACWPQGPDDIDTWYGDPSGEKPVFYNHKSNSIWALLFDDMGTVNDASPVNCENGYARATPAGEYIINLQGFRVPSGVVRVHVVISLNGSLLVKTDMDIRPKQERTVVRFTLDSKGSIVPGSQSQVFKALRSAQ